jgi:hypothetical protein
LDVVIGVGAGVALDQQPRRADAVQLRGGEQRAAATCRGRLRQIAA